MSRQDEGHTVLNLLNKSAAYLAQKGSPSPRLDAELLLASVLGCSRISLYVGFDKPLCAAEVDSYRQLVMRRGRREPVAYIIGKKEFMGRDFKVQAGALVPRPETELMAERGIEAIRNAEDPQRQVLDWKFRMVECAFDPASARRVVGLIDHG